VFLDSVNTDHRDPWFDVPRIAQGQVSYTPRRPADGDRAPERVPTHPPRPCGRGAGSP